MTFEFKNRFHKTACLAWMCAQLVCISSFVEALTEEEKEKLAKIKKKMKRKVCSPYSL